MSEANIEVVRRYIDIMNRRDYDALADVLIADHVWHGVGGGDSHGVDGFTEVIQGYVAMFPDVVMEIHNIFAGDDFVAVRQTHSGTDSGNGGRSGTATGKPFEFFMHLHARIDDGRIAEVWEVWNLLALRTAIEA